MRTRYLHLVCILGLYAMLLAPSARAAGPARLVKDIVPGADSSMPYLLTKMGETLFFQAKDGDLYTLWRSDGTPEGTAIFKQGLGIGELAVMNGMLYFSGGDRQTQGSQLWKSDGTPSGTMPLTDIHVVPPGLSVGYLTPVDDTLFFMADDGRYGYELWKSDGTPEGTGMIKNIIRSGSSNPYPLLGMNGTLFFSAFGDGTGRELWKSDGTEVGTVLVRDINPGIGDSTPRWMVELNGALFFSAYDGHEWGIWRSDGTTAGTVLVKNTTPGPEGFVPRNLTTMDKLIFFYAGTDSTGSELWKSDGTAAGTSLVKDINPGALGSYPQDFTNVNGTLLFAPSETINNLYGFRLWRSNGTPAGTVRVKDVRLMPEITQARPDGRTLFGAYNTAADRLELWQTDGTTQGTTRLQDIGPVALAYSPQNFNFTVVGSRVFLTANDGSTGRELWVIDTIDLGPPILRDRAVIAHGAPISGTLGFVDTAAYPLTYNIVTNGGKGVAAITNASSGAFTYTPKPGARGSDRFTFSASDGKHAPVVATVTVLLGPFAFLPAAFR
jgi:ELWxxDGT repeat protein